MHWGARVFVFLVFAVLGLSFLASTATLAYEFRDAQWTDFLTLDSHLFLFFPTFGIVALAAFYLPACAFVDLYWRHVRYGKLRFVAGLAVLVAGSIAIAGFILASPKRSAWEIVPHTLLADKGEPANCSRGDAACARMPYLEALANLRAVSRSRIGLADFARDCKSDTLIELPPNPAKRFCFASTPLGPKPLLQTDDECCQAQHRLETAVTTAFINEGERSLTHLVHSWLLPFKIMFLLILLAISLLLAVRFRSVETHYVRHIGRIERGLVIGAAAAMFFPFMSQGFLESSGALVGVNARGTFSTIVPVLSVVFGVWLLLIVFYFYRRRDKQLEMLGKLGGALAGAFAALKYNIIASIFVRFLGSGASMPVLGILIGLSILALVAVAWPSRQALEAEAAGLPPTEDEMSGDAYSSAEPLAVPDANR
jgi:hypothetical protein